MKTDFEVLIKARIVEGEKGKKEVKGEKNVKKEQKVE